MGMSRFRGPQGERVPQTPGAEAHWAEKTAEHERAIEKQGINPDRVLAKANQGFPQTPEGDEARFQQMAAAEEAPEWQAEPEDLSIVPGFRGAGQSPADEPYEPLDHITSPHLQGFARNWAEEGRAAADPDAVYWSPEPSEPEAALSPELREEDIPYAALDENKKFSYIAGNDMGETLNNWDKFRLNESKEK